MLFQLYDLNEISVKSIRRFVDYYDGNVVCMQCLDRGCVAQACVELNDSSRELK